MISKKALKEWIEAQRGKTIHMPVIDQNALLEFIDTYEEPKEERIKYPGEDEDYYIL